MIKFDRSIFIILFLAIILAFFFHNYKIPTFDMSEKKDKPDFEERLAKAEQRVAVLKEIFSIDDKTEKKKNSDGKKKSYLPNLPPNMINNFV